MFSVDLFLVPEFLAIIFDKLTCMKAHSKTSDYVFSRVSDKKLTNIAEKIVQGIDLTFCDSPRCPIELRTLNLAVSYWRKLARAPFEITHEN